MVANPSTSPATAPAEAPSPELVFQDVANQTDRELTKLKVEMGIDATNPNHKEIEKIEAFFRVNKDKIKIITRAEIGKLKTAVQDDNGDNEVLEGDLQLTDSGSIELKNSADTPPNTPTETPPTGSPEAVEAVNADPETKEFLEQISQKPIENRGNGMREFVINILKGFTDIPFIGGLISGMLLKLEGYTSSTEKLQVAETIMSIQSAMNAVGAGKTAQRLGELPPQEQRDITNVLLQKKEFYDSTSEMVIPSKIKKYFTTIMEKGEIERYKQPSLSQTIIQMIQGNDPSKILVEPEPTPTAAPIAAVVPETAEEEVARERREKLTELEAAAGADNTLEKAIKNNSAGHPDIEAAQKAVDDIKNASKDRLVTSLTKAEETLQSTKDQLTLAKQEKEKAETAQDTEKAKTLEQEIARMTSLIARLEGENGIIQNIRNIAKELIENFDAGTTDWKVKENLTAKNSLEQVQKAENEVEKIQSLSEGKEKEEGKEEQKTEKVNEKMKRDKEKYFGIYEKIKKSNEGYYEDKKEGIVYLIDDKGNLFNYSYHGGLDRIWNWGRNLFSDNNLPKDNLDINNQIQLYKTDNTWTDIGMKTTYMWRTVSTWESNRSRVKMANDAPDIPDWYTS